MDREGASSTRFAAPIEFHSKQNFHGANAGSDPPVDAN
jgi:hypothetical protein